MVAPVCTDVLSRMTLIVRTKYLIKRVLRKLRCNRHRRRQSHNCFCHHQRHHASSKSSTSGWVGLSSSSSSMAVELGLGWVDY